MPMPDTACPSIVDARRMYPEGSLIERHLMAISMLDFRPVSIAATSYIWVSFRLQLHWVFSVEFQSPRFSIVGCLDWFVVSGLQRCINRYPQ